ncbi:hypothetical protein N0V94_006829 [Neodidymelliopsis sp. IMI 364377]|nr:hypothetical protein N0V94_006829 [Neodidymelliopsis sp. IMI 364377]
MSITFNLTFARNVLQKKVKIIRESADMASEFPFMINARFLSLISRTVSLTKISLASFVEDGYSTSIFATIDLLLCPSSRVQLNFWHMRSATISTSTQNAYVLSISNKTGKADTPQLEFRWADRQFHVPPHVSNKIASGATRDLLVRGIGGRVTEERIRDHLDHIHNLTVIDVCFKNGDVYISTNSIHNALFARTCMMSRTTYKGTKIEWASDECAVPLPQPTRRARTPTMHIPTMAVPMTNMFALLDTGSDADSDSQPDSYLANGIRLDRNDWANTVVA